MYGVTSTIDECIYLSIYDPYVAQSILYDVVYRGNCIHLVLKGANTRPLMVYIPIDMLPLLRMV